MTRPDQRMPRAAPRTYVLAHGSWHGAWCWRELIPYLTGEGHRVHTLSYTGMGERAHLLAPGITIDTFVADIVGLIESEELENVTLVGHSFGGIPITGAAARIPQRLAQLVYLDAALVPSGQSAFDTYPPADAQARIAAAHAECGGLAVPPPRALSASWGLAPGDAGYDWLMRRMSPHPLSSYTTPLHYEGLPGNGVPAVYIECCAPVNPLLESARAMAKALARPKSEGGADWEYLMLEAPHEAMITDAEELAALLLDL